MRKLPIVLIAAGSIAAAGAQAATEIRIGTTSSAKNDVTGLLGSARRALKLGDGVFQNETIVTGRNAGAQLLFRDETALTMGPESRVILDKVIYDPDKKTGEMSIRAVTGAFRFVTGSGPKQGYRIDTPVGTIGVRGTIVEIRILGPSKLILSLAEGGAYIKVGQKQIELTQPGTYAIIEGNSAEVRSKSEKSCGSGEGCVYSDDNLLVQFLGLGRFLNDLTPALGPTAPPGNGPPPPPPPQNGFPPIQTGAGTVPPGLENKSTLPPGLANRGPSFLPPGQQKK